MGRVITRFLCLVLSIAGVSHGIVRAQESSPEAIPRSELPEERAWDFAFNDIDIQTLQRRLSRIGLQFPVGASGDLSGWLWVQRSSQGWFDFGKYRVEAALTSPELQVEGWAFRQAKLRFGYSEGLWRVYQLCGEVRHTELDEAIGLAELRLTVPTSDNENDTDSVEPAATRVAELEGKFQNANLVALAELFGVPLRLKSTPAQLTLRGTVNANQLRSLPAWDLTADVTAEQIAVFSNNLRQTALAANLVNGDLQADFSTSVADGNIDLSGKWLGFVEKLQTSEGTEVFWPTNASLQLNEVNLERIRHASLALKLSGLAQGKWEFNTVRDQGLLRWSTEGDLRIADLLVGGSNLGDLRIQAEKLARDSQLIGKVSLLREQGSLSAEATLSFPEGAIPQELIDFELLELTGEINSVVLTSNDFGYLAEDVSLTANGDFHLYGTPEQLLQFADIHLSDSTVNVGESEYTIASAWLQANEQEFRIPQLAVVNGNQAILGSAVFRRDQQQEHLLNLRINQWQLDPWVSSFAPAALSSLGGEADLKMRLRKSAAEPDWAYGWEGLASGGIKDLRWQQSSIGTLSLNAELSPGEIRATAEGDLLGGRLESTSLLEANGRVPASFPEDSGHEVTTRSQTKVLLRDLELENLLELLVGPSEARKFVGKLNLQSNIETEDSVIENADFALQLPFFFYQRQPVVRDLQVAGKFDGQLLDIQSFRGSVAGGQVNVQGTWADQESASLSVDLRNLHLKPLLSIFDPDLSESMDGRFSYRGRVNTGANPFQFSTSGNAVLQDATLYDLPIQMVRGRLYGKINLPTGQLMVESRNLFGKVLGGDFIGRAQIEGGRRFGLSSSMQLSRGDMVQLSQAIGFDSMVGQGTFDASAFLESGDIGEIDQLAGSLLLEFENGNTRSVPLVGDVFTYLPLGQLSSTEISGGVVRANLGQGQVYVEEFLVLSEAYWIALSGKLGLVGGRLDMEGVIQTGGGWQQQVGAQALLQLAPTFAPQLALLNEVANLVRNRTFYLRIAGTTKSPVIKPRLLQSVGRATLQNLLRQTFGVSTLATGSAQR